MCGTVQLLASACPVVVMQCLWTLLNDYVSSLSQDYLHWNDLINRVCAPSALISPHFARGLSDVLHDEPHLTLMYKVDKKHCP